MNPHPTEEQLVLYYYGDIQEAPAMAAHLEDCAACRDGYHALQRVLNSVDSLSVPERAPDYESHVWRRLVPLLKPTKPWYRPWSGWKPLMIAVSIAVLLVAAFLAGRTLKPPVKETIADAAQLRERVLLVALGAHLERTKMMLVELANAQPVGGQVDISFEQESAAKLLEANRLYRQTALNAGNYQVTALLEELERVMLELAHSPASVPERQLEDLCSRMEERSLLFKVKVFSSQFENRAAALSSTSL